MRSLIFLFSFFLFIACGQKENKTGTAKPAFSYFELSYHNDGAVKGDLRSLSFCTDSNKIFFLPHTLPQIDGDSVMYGFLPDSIYQSIDTIIKEIRNMRSQDPDSIYCYDCDAISIKVIAKGDTMRFFQQGDINDRIWRLIETLGVLKKSDRLQQFKAIYFFMETLLDVNPPPKIKERE